MSDDDYELSLSEIDPSIQTIELKDSLDLSRLKVTPRQREVLAEALHELTYYYHIPCADLASKSLDNNTATIAWCYKRNGKAVLMSVVMNLTTLELQYTMGIQNVETASTNKDSFITALRGVALMNRLEKEESLALN